MNVNINFNGNSLAMDNTAEDTTAVSDAGAPPSSLEISDTNEENNEASDVASASEAMDIGGPPEWLVQSITSTTETEEDTATEGLSDGGSGPVE